MVRSIHTDANSLAGDRHRSGIATTAPLIDCLRVNGSPFLFLLSRANPFFISHSTASRCPSLAA